jgi:hypothetical protein
MLELTEKGLTQSSANARENHKQKQKHITTRDLDCYSP